MYIGRYQAEWESDREFCNLWQTSVVSLSFLCFLFLILQCKVRILWWEASVAWQVWKLRSKPMSTFGVLYYTIAENTSLRIDHVHDRMKKENNKQTTKTTFKKTWQIFSIPVLACYLWQFLIPGTFFETLCIINCNIMCTQSLVVKETKLGKGNDPDLCSKLFPQTCKLLPPM